MKTKKGKNFLLVPRNFSAATNRFLKICTYFAGHTFVLNDAKLPVRFVNSLTGARLQSRENTMIELNQIFILVCFITIMMLLLVDAAKGV